MKPVISIGAALVDGALSCQRGAAQSYHEPRPGSCTAGWRWRSLSQVPIAPCWEPRSVIDRCGGDGDGDWLNNPARACGVKLRCPESPGKDRRVNTQYPPRRRWFPLVCGISADEVLTNHLVTTGTFAKHRDRLELHRVCTARIANINEDTIDGWSGVVSAVKRAFHLSLRPVSVPTSHKLEDLNLENGFTTGHPNEMNCPPYVPKSTFTQPNRLWRIELLGRGVASRSGFAMENCSSALVAVAERASCSLHACLILKVVWLHRSRRWFADRLFGHRKIHWVETDEQCLRLARALSAAEITAVQGNNAPRLNQSALIWRW